MHALKLTELTNVSLKPKTMLFSAMCVIDNGRFPLFSCKLSFLLEGTPEVGKCRPWRYCLLRNHLILVISDDALANNQHQFYEESMVYLVNIPVAYESERFNKN